jgi:hypothetical protein
MTNKGDAPACESGAKVIASLRPDSGYPRLPK